MKLILSTILIIMMVLSAIISYAADLKWDASTGEVVGYNVYFTTGSDTFRKNVGNVIEVLDIDKILNLYPGKEYTFTVTAHNLIGESETSNAVNYTAAEYVPPDDNLPPVIIIIPGPVTIIVE